jgi:hypothetical protein
MLNWKKILNVILAMVLVANLELTPKHAITAMAMVKFVKAKTWALLLL